jgi:hypothetical protein
VLQLPAGFRFEPLNLAKGDVVTLPAGSGLPETSISVVNGTGNRVVKSLVGGQRQQLKVVRLGLCALGVSQPMTDVMLAGAWCV